MKKILTLTTAMSLAAMPVLAGGLSEPEPTPMIEVPQAQPVAPMTGDWTGFYAGAQLGYGDVTTDGAADVEGDDVLYGVHAGYMYDFGTYVLGGEIDYDASEIDLDGAGTLDSVARLKVRAGYDAGPALIYATAGLAQAEAELGGTDFTGDGYALGVGATYRVTDNILVGGEYLYHNFEDFDDTGIDVDANTISARVSFQF